MIQEGMNATLTELVGEENTAEKIGSGSLPVYATPAMIALIERCAVKTLKGHLPEGSTTVGTRLAIDHVSATPMGMEVSCRCTLSKIDRKRFVFDVLVEDEAGVIGKGSHERFLVEAAPFLSKAEDKKKGAGREKNSNA